MTVEEKLEAVLAKLDRLEAIESHLLDLLIPGRGAYRRQPNAAPPPVLADDVKQVRLSLDALHMKVDTLHDRLPAASDPAEQEQ